MENKTSSRDVNFQEANMQIQRMNHLVTPQEVTDVLIFPTMIVNICLIGDPEQHNKEWVLVDTGIMMFSNRIITKAEERFGRGNKPAAIILTHGHFDHVGNVIELAELWDVPVYAHEMELPYLIGEQDYPPADPTVGGGIMAEISPLYPHKGINLGTRVKALPSDGSLPFLPSWRSVHTPGHTPGHISLFRDKDRVLISGDAFITVQQESALAVLTQEKEVNGPPMYFTTDWHEAWDSVKKLETLHPSIVYPGHGKPMFGDELMDGLQNLARHFDQVAIPKQGRYVQ